MSNPPSQKIAPRKRKSAAKLASEANTRQQKAVRANSPRPNDRQPGDPQGMEAGRQFRRPGQH